MHPKLCLALAFILVSSLFPSQPLLADWPQLRGPDQDGKATVSDIFDGPIELTVSWRRPLGKGYSQVVVADDVAVTLYADPRSDRDVVAAFDTANGSLRWSVALAETYRGHNGSDDGPIATPTIAGKTVYALGPRGQLVAVELSTGKERWRRDLVATGDARKPFYGFSTSPYVLADRAHGDRLVLMTGRADGRTLTAFDPATGEPLWRRGDDTSEHTTILDTRLGDRRQLVAFTNQHLIGLDPIDGRERWRQRLDTGEIYETLGMAVRVDDDGLLVQRWEESVLYRLGADGAIGEAWRSNQLKASYSVPIHHDGHVYGYNGRFLTCVDAKTGKQVWKSRPPGGHGNMLLAGRHFLTVGDDGDLVAFAASPEGYRETARLATVLSSASITAPSLSDDRMYLRDGESLVAVKVVAKPLPKTDD
ncbi:MAG: PQQ-binding-like beta-propeller repeat protein [Acidobacteriota bacterium]